MKKFKFFALAALFGMSINAMAVTDGTYLYSADGLDYSCVVSGTGTVFQATVVGLTTGNTSATSVTIPATLKPVGTGADANIINQTFDVVAIAKDAFYLKSTLATVTISGEKLTTIGGRAFQGTAVASIALPKTVTTIGQGAFKNTQLATFTWAPTDASTIADSAFVNTQLTTFTVPAKVTSLGATNGYVFAESAKLATLTVAASSELASMKANLIWGTAVEELDLTPAKANLCATNITDIADDAFASETLKKVIFAVYAANGTATAQNNKITSIPDGWFAKSYALQEVVFPTTLSSIEASAFANAALTTLDLSHSAAAVTLSDMFAAKAKAPYSTLTSVKFPDLVGQKIATKAFAYCTGLTTITFPTKWNTASSTEVASNAFQGCTGLTGITFIPAAVTNMNQSVFATDAFADCTPTIIITSNKAYVDKGYAAPTNCAYGAVTPGTAKEITLNGSFALLAQDNAWKISPDSAIVYDVYVDGISTGGDGTIYMVPFQVKGGYYQVAGSNVPVLLKAKNATNGKITIYQDAGITASSSFVTTSALKRTSAVTSVSSLVTTTQYVNVAAIADGVFGFTSPAGSTLPAKTYYVLSEKQYGAASARIVWLDENDDATAIIGAKKAINAEDGEVYNLAGQRVDANFKGIVVKNGKKFIQK